MLTPEKRKVLEIFADGRKLYKLMKFAEARDKFLEALAIDPADGPSKVYVQRCDHYRDDPPPEDWDGVYVMKTK